MSGSARDARVRSGMWPRRCPKPENLSPVFFTSGALNKTTSAYAVALIWRGQICGTTVALLANADSIWRKPRLTVVKEEPGARLKVAIAHLGQVLDFSYTKA